jgi:hypothetical protein
LGSAFTGQIQLEGNPGFPGMADDLGLPWCHFSD